MLYSYLHDVCWSTKADDSYFHPLAIPSPFQGEAILNILLEVSADCEL